MPESARIRVSNRRIAFELWLVYVLVVGFAAAATLGGWLSALDRLIYDNIVEQLAGPLPEDVVIVGIDEQSLYARGRWPWGRGDQAELLEVIASGEPRGVMVDILYSEPGNPRDDEALTAALGALPNLTLPIVIDAVSQAGALLEVMPLPELIDLAEALGHVHPELDDDGISRGVFLFHGVGEPHWPHVSLAHANRASGAEDALEPGEQCEGELYSLRNIVCDYRLVPFSGPPGTFRTVSALDLLTDERGALARKLRDKTVLVGVTASTVSDWVTTPVSGESSPMAGVEYNANVLAAVRGDALITVAPLVVTLVCVLMLASLPPLVLPRLLPGSMLLATVGFVVLPLALFVALLFIARFYVPLSAAAVAAALTFPLWSWRRLSAAWRFFSREIERVDAERLQLGHAEFDLGRFHKLADHVAQVLGGRARVGVVPRDAEYQGVVVDRLGDGDHRLTGRALFGDRTFELQIVRAELFAGDERRYLETALTVVEPEPVAPASVERMGREMRQLNRLADDVRTTRDVNMRSLEQITSGVCLVSFGGLVEYVNSSFTDLTTITSERNLLDIERSVHLPAGMSWVEVVRRVVVDNESVSFETRTRDDATILVDCAPLRLEAGFKGYWLMTVVDVSDIRLAERQREEALAFLSHDLRSPMVSILALVRGKAPGENGTGADGPVSGILDQIGAYAEKSLNVSEQFVQLSRVESQEQFETYDVELGAIACNALEQVLDQARAKGIAIAFDDRTGDDGLWLNANGELLERVIVNLLTNAVKYSRENSTAALVVYAEAETGDACCEVIDRGYGIPSAELARIFEPYFRSTVREIAAQRGAGLGLRFVKTVTERHGGEVEVESAPDRGSTFRLRFPAARLLSIDSLDDDLEAVSP